MEKLKSRVPKTKSSMSASPKSNRKIKVRRNKRKLIHTESRPFELSLTNTAGAFAVQREVLEMAPTPNREQKRYPDLNVDLSTSSTESQLFENKHQRVKRKRIIRNRKTFMTLHEHVYDDTKIITMVESVSLQQTYESESLHDSNNNFEILLPTVPGKDKHTPIRTPTLDSSETSIDNMKWSICPVLKKQSEDDIYLVKEIANNLTECNTLEKMKVNQNANLTSPQPLVPHDDKRIFNFIVNFLESSVQLYDNKAKYDRSSYTSSAKSSEVTLEIGESVANKLNVVQDKNDDELPIVLPRKDSKVCAYLQNAFDELNNETPVQNIQIETSLSESKIYREKTSLKTATKKKRSNHMKKSEKKIMNMIKEKLKLDFYPTPREEPKDLFEALKEMAKNKRKTEQRL